MDETEALRAQLYSLRNTVDRRTADMHELLDSITRPATESPTREAGLDVASEQETIHTTQPTPPSSQLGQVQGLVVERHCECVYGRLVEQDQPRLSRKRLICNWCGALWAELSIAAPDVNLTT